MAIRIKSSWHHSGRNDSRAKGMADHAGALAFIAWRLSLEAAKSLHGDGFDYLSDRARVGVLCEFVAFSLQRTDRIAHGTVDDEARDTLLNALAHRLSDHVQENLEEIAGPGGYRAPFIALMNRRLDDYAECPVQADAPGYAALRYLGHQVLNAIEDSQTNQWVVDHVISISAPEFSERYDKAVRDLIRTHAADTPPRAHGSGASSK